MKIQGVFSSPSPPERDQARLEAAVIDTGKRYHFSGAMDGSGGLKAFENWFMANSVWCLFLIRSLRRSHSTLVFINPWIFFVYESRTQIMKSPGTSCRALEFSLLATGRFAANRQRRAITFYLFFRRSRHLAEQRNVSAGGSRQVCEGSTFFFPLRSKIDGPATIREDDSMPKDQGEI